MKIDPCPFCCHDDPHWEDAEGELLRLCCSQCGAAGPVADSVEAAAALWNR